MEKNYFLFGANPKCNCDCVKIHVRKSENNRRNLKKRIKICWFVNKWEGRGMVKYDGLEGPKPNLSKCSKYRVRPLVMNRLFLCCWYIRRGLKAGFMLVPLFGLQLLLTIYRPDVGVEAERHMEYAAFAITNSQVHPRSCSCGPSTWFICARRAVAVALIYT